MILPRITSHPRALAITTTGTDLSCGMIRMTATSAADDVDLVSAVLTLTCCSFHTIQEKNGVYKGFLSFELGESSKREYA